jgi:hypothetical protein
MHCHFSMKRGRKLEVVLLGPVRAERMLITHQVGGNSHIRLPTTTERSFEGEKNLGENHQKLAIPA